MSELPEINLTKAKRPRMKRDWQWSCNPVTVNGLKARLWWNNTVGLRSYLELGNQWFIAKGKFLDDTYEFSCKRTLQNKTN